MLQLPALWRFLAAEARAVWWWCDLCFSGCVAPIPAEAGALSGGAGGPGGHACGPLEVAWLLGSTSPPPPAARPPVAAGVGRGVGGANTTGQNPRVGSKLLGGCSLQVLFPNNYLVKCDAVLQGHLADWAEPDGLTHFDQKSLF